jgi:hypothetical protein
LRFYPSRSTVTPAGASISERTETSACRVYRIGTYIPYPVQELIIAAEAALILQLVHHRRSAYTKQLNEVIFIKEVDANKAETGIADSSAPMKLTSKIPSLTA